MPGWPWIAALAPPAAPQLRDHRDQPGVCKAPEWLFVLALTMAPSVPISLAAVFCSQKCFFLLGSSSKRCWKHQKRNIAMNGESVTSWNPVLTHLEGCKCCFTCCQLTWVLMFSEYLGFFKYFWNRRAISIVTQSTVEKSHPTLWSERNQAHEAESRIWPFCLNIWEKENSSLELILTSA